MATVESTLDRVNDLKDSLEVLKSKLAWVDDISLEDADDALGLKKSAELNVGLAFAMSSLFFIMLKTKGITTADHPIKEDISRIKAYVAKIQKLNGVAKSKKRKIVVNSEASKRIVSHELGDDNRSRGPPLKELDGQTVPKVEVVEGQVNIPNLSSNNQKKKKKKSKKTKAC